MILEQDFSRDFDLLTAGLHPGYSGPPYSLARFADGEAGIMRGRGHVAKSDGWEYPSGPCWETCGGADALPRKLVDSLACDLLGYHVGLTAEEHHPDDHNFLEDFCDEFSGPPASRRTFAEIFLFDNWPKFRELDLSHCFVVGPEGDYSIPRDSVASYGWREIASGVVKHLVSHVRQPILIAAGPLANAIIHEYWQRACGEKWCQVILDVGSAISHILHPGRRIRAFQRPSDPRANWRPRWKLTE
jgi:hypothetical protein